MEKDKDYRSSERKAIDVFCQFAKADKTPAATEGTDQNTEAFLKPDIIQKFATTLSKNKDELLDQYREKETQKEKAGDGESNLYQERIQALEREKKELEEKLREARQPTHNEQSEQGANMGLQEIVQQYNDAAGWERQLEIKEMETFFPDIMAFLRPYMEKYKDQELAQVIEKIPYKERKKFASDMWLKNQDSIRNLLREKNQMHQKFLHLSRAIDQLDQEKFDDFARQITETRHLTSLANAAESIYKLTHLMDQNGEQKLNAES